MKADKLDYNNINVIIDRILADFEGYETEIPQIKATTIYEEQEINQLVGLQASIVTMLTQYLIWKEIIDTIDTRLDFYQEIKDDDIKKDYYKLLKEENTKILILYRELVVFQHIILALKKTLNLAYGEETANKLEVEIKKIQEYYSRYNEIVDDVLKILKNDEKIEAEKVILRKPIYKKDFKQFEEKVSDKKTYLSSYSALVRGLADLVNVEIENDKETTWL